jgi:hypothetical protein
MKIQATFATLRCRTLRSPATVLSQPKHSSTRFRFFWLIVYSACRVVRASMALRPAATARRVFACHAIQYDHVIISRNHELWTLSYETSGATDASALLPAGTDIVN